MIIIKPGFQFSFYPEACNNCGGMCCQDERGDRKGVIWLEHSDIDKMLKFLNMELMVFIVKYGLSLRPVNGVWRPVLLIKDGRCPFLLRGRCEIYPARPLQCRLFPFWDQYRQNPEQVLWECPGTKLIRVKWAEKRR